MNNETMSIKRENLLNAYKNASNEQKSFLENLFGTETFKSDVRERIKTFEDACHELGIEPDKWIQDKIELGLDTDVVAYLKLRIITAALNEGWEPQFIPDECRWAPYFELYIQEEIDKMNEKTKARVVFRSHNSANANGGVSFADANSGSAYVNASIGSRLAFKSKELAEYAGRQFIDVYVDFMLGWELEK